MGDFTKIVSMITWGERVMIATPDSVYEMVDGKPVLVASPEDFKRADEEWARTHEQPK